jgi:hypothetical protein
MAGTLVPILATKADLVDGKVKADQLPESTGGITLNDVKSDADIASALSLKHSNTTDHASGSDNQDLSGLQPKETGKGLSTNDYSAADKDKLTAVPIIKVSTTEPQNPQVNDIWIDIS